MNTQPYPTGLTDSQWGILQDLIPLAGPGGCPRSLDMRSVVNAILYVVVGGIQWRTSPVDSLEQFLSAATGVGSPRLVCMHPELLAPETDSALATRITAMCIQRDGHYVQVLKKNRALSGC